MSDPVPVPLPPAEPAKKPRRSGLWVSLTALGVKLLSYSKFLLIFLKTGGSMLVFMWVYALMWGWSFAAGFALLIFVHECGHLVVARRFGLKVGLPVFIPFMGAIIALKEAPRDAWMEAWVGIGGPLFGAAGALACAGLYAATGNPLFRALAYSGCMLNLFNLMPITPLDGGRIATAISPWLWLIGLAVVGVLLVFHFNFILLIIAIVSLPRIVRLLRGREASPAYFSVTPLRRWTMAVLYFGLAGVLAVGMHLSRFDPNPPAQTEQDAQP